MSIRATNVAAKMNPDRQVESFDMAGAYKTRLGMSASDAWDRLHNPAHGTVPVRPGDVRTRIEFYQLREVNVFSEMCIYGVNIRAVSIAGKLENTLRSGAKVAHEIPRGVRVSVANVVRDDELGFAVQRKPRPNSAPLSRSVGAQALFVASDERVHFVCLYQIGANVPYRRVKQSLAFVSGAYHQIQDRADVQSSYAGDRTHAHAFHHHFEHAGSGVNVNVVGFESFDRLGEGSFAGLAAPTLDAALTEVTEFLAALVLAFDAGHRVSPLAFCGETRHNELGSRAWVTPRFGLAPLPVSAGSGAFNQLVSFGGGRVIGFHLSFLRDHLRCGLSDLFEFPQDEFGGQPSQFSVAHFVICWRYPLVAPHTSPAVATRFDFSLFLKTFQRVVNGHEFLFVFGEIVPPLHQLVAYSGYGDNFRKGQSKYFPNGIGELKKAGVRCAKIRVAFVTSLTGADVLGMHCKFHVGRQTVGNIFTDGFQAVYHTLPVNDLYVDLFTLCQQLFQFPFSLCECDFECISHGGKYMSKTGKFVKKKFTTETGKFGWEAALERAVSHLYKNRLQAKRLKAAIAVFREKMAEGEPWPGDKSAASPTALQDSRGV
jgi:hypothetical protein